MTAWAVYRCFDDLGGLVYIGSTGDPAARYVEHASRSEWAGRVARVEVERFPTRAEALAAERAAILLERPPFNRVRQQRKVLLGPRKPAPEQYPTTLISKIGSVEAFAAAASIHELAPEGRALKPSAVYMWKTRGKVPHMWRPVVRSLAQTQIAGASQ